MTCLQSILHALALHGRPVMLRVSTLAERAGPELAALRPDLSHRDQIKHWASLQGLVAHWDREELMVTFHPIDRAGARNDETRMANEEGEAQA